MTTELEERIPAMEDYVDGEWVFTVDGKVTRFKDWRKKKEFLLDEAEARKAAGDMRLISRGITRAAIEANKAPRAAYNAEIVPGRDYRIYSRSKGWTCILCGAHYKLDPIKKWWQFWRKGYPPYHAGGARVPPFGWQISSDGDTVFCKKCRKDGRWRMPRNISDYFKPTMKEFMERFT